LSSLISALFRGGCPQATGEFRDDSLVRQHIGAEAERNWFPFVERWNAGFALDPNSGTLQLVAEQ
jgi:hypothetical protein